MNDEDYPIDEPQTALATVKPDGELVAAEAHERTPLSPADARNNAVAAVTMTAYAKAGELKLTAEENAALDAVFPDEDFLEGAGGDNRLIYIKHSALRQRLNAVIGRGAWALVVRDSWTEKYMTKGGNGKPPQEAVTVYSRVMLVVRGCYVGEAVGTMDYFPANQKTTYADAFEGSKTAAFRRCAKDFGVGLQAWDKTWCDGWWKRRHSGPRQQPVQATPQKEHPAIVLLRRASVNGLDAYRYAWEGLTNQQRAAVPRELHEEFKKAAAAVPKRGDAYEPDGSDGIV